MSKAEAPPTDGKAEWERFQRLGRQVLAVPAEEIRQREAAYRDEGKHAPRNPGRPKGAKTRTRPEA